MNDDEFSERPSAFMLGKEFIIVLVIVFSGLSFTLGYFVGKSGDGKPQSALQPVESTDLSRRQELTPAPPSPTATPAPEQTQAVLPPINEAVVPVSEQPVLQKSSAAQVPDALSDTSAQKIEPAAVSKNTIYTVQIGAFKNIADARNLKAKFDRKGYRSFISEGKNNKAQKVFKVKTGEFREKKEAEVAALKIKKAEGLQTYVTMKTQ